MRLTRQRDLHALVRVRRERKCAPLELCSPPSGRERDLGGVEAEGRVERASGMGDVENDCEEELKNDERECTKRNKYSESHG